MRPLVRTARLLPLLAALGSCSAVTTMTGPVGAFPEPRPLPVAGTDLFDWKGMVHCHGYLSHDSDGTVEQIHDAADFARFDFVVMTDHQTDQSIADGQRGRVGDVLFVVGAEVRTPQGTVIAFPLQRPLRRWMSAGALLAEAKEQGAIGVICHAERWPDWDVPGLSGAEIVNLHAGAMTANPVDVILTALLLPVRLLMQTVALRDDAVFRSWDAALQRRHPMAPLGGGDAHNSLRVFGPLGGTIANYREVFLTVSTHVLARSLDERSLVEAIVQGRTYVSFDVFGEGGGFDFRAVDGSGGVHLPGATIPGTPGLQLRVHTPAAGTIELWRDGAIVQRARDATELVRDQPEPGVWRVEVRTTAGSPWLFSSSIRVE